MTPPDPTDPSQKHRSSETESSVEKGRLEALHRYDVIDSGTEEPFDRIARLAADLFDVPAVIVSFVGKDRQWFKSAVGIEKQEMSLDDSFCGHAITSEEPMVVEDATADERFADSPLVTEEPGFRFYAGMPLVTPGGYRIGTFCVLDTKPRTLSANELDRLDDLAEMVMGELELRREALAREEAKQAFREERDRLATLLDSLPVSVVHGIPNEDEFRVLTVNSTFEETFGVSASVIEGDDLHDHIVPEDRAGEAEGINRRVREESSLQAEVRRRSTDGVRTFRLEATTRNPENGSPEAYAIYTDVTGQKEKEQEIERLQCKYRALLESAPDAILVADAASGRIVEANEAAASLLETTEEDIVGAPQSQLHPSGEEERYRSLFEKHARLASGGSEMIDQFDDGSPLYVVTRSGTRIPVEINAAPVDLEGRKLVIGVFRDITERRKRARKLKTAKEQAERMSRMKSTFLANMSHEIRTPLTSIIGFAEAIAEEAEDLTVRLEEAELSTLVYFAGLIEQSGHNLLDTLDAVLNLSKLEAGEMELSPERTDVAEAAKGAAVQFEPQAAEADVDLQVEVDKPSIRAWADEGGVQIVLRNLLSNALKYTQEGGQVWIRVGEERGSVTLEVEDTGIGMDSDKIDDLFDAFKQESEGVDREYEGSGLGLAVTQKAVRQMEGSIDVETEKGEGSRFVVRLPRAEGVNRENGT